jgi:hypothetical protein
MQIKDGVPGSALSSCSFVRHENTTACVFWKVIRRSLNLNGRGHFRDVSISFLHGSQHRSLIQAVANSSGPDIRRNRIPCRRDAHLDTRKRHRWLFFFFCKVKNKPRKENLVVLGLSCELQIVLLCLILNLRLFIIENMRYDHLRWKSFYFD